MQSRLVFPGMAGQGLTAEPVPKIIPQDDALLCPWCGFAGHGLYGGFFSKTN